MFEIAMLLDWHSVFATSMVFTKCHIAPWRRNGELLYWPDGGELNLVTTALVKHKAVGIERNPQNIASDNHSFLSSKGKCPKLCYV